LLYDVFTAVSDEARAKNTEFSEEGGLKRYQGLTMWTPNINIFRDPPIKLKYYEIEKLFSDDGYCIVCSSM
ncbi:hypothetical protein, partial [Phocaeicola sp.]|uniref:hypothetical protein n=1 Tax=Phocaeicola sp. TaxID=2773926 RepID=UPI003AB2EEFB